MSDFSENNITKLVSLYIEDEALNTISILNAPALVDLTLIAINLKTIIIKAPITNFVQSYQNANSITLTDVNI